MTFRGSVFQKHCRELASRRRLSEVSGIPDSPTAALLVFRPGLR
jgi:hypothetical protein